MTCSEHWFLPRINAGAGFRDHARAFHSRRSTCGAALLHQPPGKARSGCADGRERPDRVELKSVHHFLLLFFTCLAAGRRVAQVELNRIPGGERQARWIWPAAEAADRSSSPCLPPAPCRHRAFARGAAGHRPIVHERPTSRTAAPCGGRRPRSTNGAGAGCLLVACRRERTDLSAVDARISDRPTVEST